jgi:hypothetical protein
MRNVAIGVIWIQISSYIDCVFLHSTRSGFVVKVLVLMSVRLKCIDHIYYFLAYSNCGQCVFP